MIIPHGYNLLLEVSDDKNDDIILGKTVKYKCVGIGTHPDCKAEAGYLLNRIVKVKAGSEGAVHTFNETPYHLVHMDYIISSIK